MKFGSQSIYVLSDDCFLKIVRVGLVKGQRCITGVYVKDITGLTIDGASRELTAGLSAMHASTKEVRIVLPCKYVITKNIEVPSLKDDEIQSIVRLQAVRHTPYSKEEVTVGFLNLEILLERYTKTLLVIGSNENIRRKTNIAQIIGLDIESVRLSAEGMARAVNVYLKSEEKEGPCACIYLDCDSTDFITVNKQKPYFIRSIPLGQRQLHQDPEANANKLTEEILKTRSAYEEEDQGTALKSFLVTGLSSPEQQLLAQTLQAKQSVPVEVVALERVLNISSEGAQQVARNPNTTFLDLMTTALYETDLSVNLIPDDLKLKKSFRDRAREMVIAGVFMMMIFAMIVGIFIVQIYFRNKCLREMKEGFERGQSEAGKLVALSEETKLIRNFKKRREVALKALDQFQKLLPAQMYVSEVTLNDEGRFSIKGTSELMSLVFSFVTEMENDPYFKNVTSDYTKSRKENEKDVSDFGISCNLDEESIEGGLTQTPSGGSPTAETAAEAETSSATVEAQPPGGES